MSLRKSQIEQTSHRVEADDRDVGHSAMMTGG
jgi:hypothetical protein